MRGKPILFLNLILSSVISFAFADTIILKNGETVEGKIVEQTQDFVKVDFEGVVIPYFKDEIKQLLIEGEEPVSFESKKEDTQETVKDKVAGGEVAEVEVAKAETPDLSGLDENAIITQILELSGIKKEIEQIPDHFNAFSKEQESRMPPELYAKFTQATNESFQPELIYEHVLNYLKVYFNRERFLAVLNWLESPLSKKMSQLEVEASTPEATEQMEDFFNILQSSPATKERLALAQRYDEVFGASEFVIKIQIAIFQAMTKAVDAFMPESERLKEGQLNQMSNELKAQLQLPVKNSSLMGFLYAYRSVSDEDLIKYLDFYASDTGKWFTKIMQEAFLKVIMQSSADLSNKIIKILQEQETLLKERKNQKG